MIIIRNEISRHFFRPVSFYHHRSLINCSTVVIMWSQLFLNVCPHALPSVVSCLRTFRICDLVVVGVGERFAVLLWRPLCQLYMYVYMDHSIGISVRLTHDIDQVAESRKSVTQRVATCGTRTCDRPCNPKSNALCQACVKVMWSICSAWSVKNTFLRGRCYAKHLKWCSPLSIIRSNSSMSLFLSLYCNFFRNNLYILRPRYCKLRSRIISTSL